MGSLSDEDELTLQEVLSTGLSGGLASGLVNGAASNGMHTAVDMDVAAVLGNGIGAAPPAAMIAAANDGALHDTPRPRSTAAMINSTVHNLPVDC